MRLHACLCLLRFLTSCSYVNMRVYSCLLLSVAFASTRTSYVFLVAFVSTRTCLHYYVFPCSCICAYARMDFICMTCVPHWHLCLHVRVCVSCIIICFSRSLHFTRLRDCSHIFLVLCTICVMLNFPLDDIYIFVHKQ